jgi:hypothetical protein
MVYLLTWIIHGAAKLQKEYSTQSHEANTKITKKKNNNYFNLILCPCGFLVALC